MGTGERWHNRTYSRMYWWACRGVAEGFSAWTNERLADCRRGDLWSGCVAGGGGAAAALRVLPAVRLVATGVVRLGLVVVFSARQGGDGSVRRRCVALQPGAAVDLLEAPRRALTSARRCVGCVGAGDWFRSRRPVRAAGQASRPKPCPRSTPCSVTRHPLRSDRHRSRSRIG